MEERDLSKPALKYRPEYANQVYEHIASGLSISSFNVTPTVRQTTVFQWIHDHDEFALAIDRGRAEFLKRIEIAIIHKAFGTPLSEAQQKWMPKTDGEMIRFLASRRYKNEYSDKQIIEHKGDVVTSVKFVIRRPEEEKEEEKKEVEE